MISQVIWEDGEMVTILLGISLVSRLWTWVDNLLQKQFHLGREDAENILSMFHAVTALKITDANLKDLDPTEYNPTNKTSLAEELGLIFSCSYFLYDTFRWKYRGAASTIMLSHHICSILAIIYNLSGRSWGTHGNMALLLLEGANPLLHLRRILIGEGLAKSGKLIYIITEWSFLLSFIMFRFVLGLQYVIFIIHSNAPRYLVCTAYMLLAISSMFLMRIIVILKGKIQSALDGNGQTRILCQKQLNSRMQ